MKTFLLALSLATAAAMPVGRPEPQAPHAHGQHAGPAIPAVLRAEHEGLHRQLAAVVALGGRTGAAAEALEKVLHPHFLKEEEYGLPPLGLLEDLARGEVTPEMKQVLPLTDRLRAELPRMLADHKAVGEALEKLSEAAKAENRPEALAFAEALGQHARTEEQILYPAAIVVGDYVRLKTGSPRPSQSSR